MDEIWKDVQGYEGLYQVSNLGRVKSLSRFHNNKTVGFISKERILIPRENPGRCNYFRVMLYRNKVPHSIMIHRLVADAFIPKIPGKDYVNHIDGDKQNNIVQNLEWCSLKENVQHAFSTGLNRARKGKENIKSRKIEQWTLDGNHLCTWYGLGDIYRNLGINRGNVEACLEGKRKTAGGFKWKLGH